MAIKFSLIQAIRTNPITAAVIAIAVGLFIAVKVYALQYPDDARNSYWKLGCVTKLLYVEQPELWGPLELWKGQIWRIPVSVFHHADVLHLLMNCIALGYLGWLLYGTMRVFRYSLFLMSAVLISSMPGFLIEEYSVGLSGVVYAIFGVLFVVRQHDERVNRFVPDWLVHVGILMLFFCLILTWSRIAPIANLAHFSGFIYGWLVGSVFYGHKRSRRLRIGFCAAHLLLIPAIDMTMHPVWKGRYQWYLADKTRNQDERLEHLQKAVRCDPSLVHPWHEIARIQIRKGQRMESWKTMLQSLSFNRTQPKGIELAREVWTSFSTKAEREQALQTLDETFPDEASTWQEKLRTGYALADAGVPQEPATTIAELITNPQTSDNVAKRELPALSAPDIDPNSWNSALAGETL